MPKSEHIKKERAHLKIMSKHMDTVTGKALFYSANIIDTKTQTLLTHISIIIAVLVIFLNDEKCTGNYKALIAIELVLYLAVALLCLRAIFIVNPSAKTIERSKILEKRIYELRRRRLYYTISLWSTILLTIGFIIIIIYVNFNIILTLFRDLREWFHIDFKAGEVSEAANLRP